MFKVQRFLRELFVDVIGLSFLVALIAGCSNSNFSEVAGKVLFEGNTQFEFADDVVELRSESNPDFIASGLIQPDGSFKVESLVQGKVVRGVPDGSYRARIVISDDDPKRRDSVLKTLSKKFLSFETSELTVTVPGEPLVLRLSK